MHLLQHLSVHGLLHGSLHGVGDGVAYGACQGVAEADGCIGAQPLVAAEDGIINMGVLKEEMRRQYEERRQKESARNDRSEQS